MKSQRRNEISTLVAPTPVWTGQNPCASLFGRYKANHYGSLFFLVFRLNWVFRLNQKRRQRDGLYQVFSELRIRE